MQVSVRTRIKISFKDSAGQYKQIDVGVGTAGQRLAHLALDGCTDFKATVTNKLIPNSVDDDADVTDQ